ncbi:hypothetical protein JL720_16747 [Aureococcus anophagefferens]|nr:hypothetical protein JL720_16747 [Aureococcus anophagefferens]
MGLPPPSCSPRRGVVRIKSIAAAQNKSGKNCFEGSMEEGSFTWYKDMGGNSNWMYVAVHNGTRDRVSLALWLLYEAATDPLVDPLCGSGEIQVRVNDLSSRHQNQRFVLVAGPRDAPVRGSRSVPIEILSALAPTAGDDDAASARSRSPADLAVALLGGLAPGVRALVAEKLAASLGDTARARRGRGGGPGKGNGSPTSTTSSSTVDFFVDEDSGANIFDALTPK